MVMMLAMMMAMMACWSYDDGHDENDSGADADTGDDDVDDGRYFVEANNDKVVLRMTTMQAMPVMSVRMMSMIDDASPDGVLTMMLNVHLLMMQIAMSTQTRTHE